MHRRLVCTAALLIISGASARAEPTGWRGTALAGVERTDAAPGAGASDGFFYGGQVGYDWQVGPILAGIEGDLGGSTARQDVGGRRARQGVFATAAVRVAVPLGTRLRAFARGGYAYHTVTYDTGSAFHGSGWTLGGGGEADLSDRLFVRGEYRYSDYGSAVRGQHFLLGAGIRF